jgi:hypothetical protein
MCRQMTWLSKEFYGKYEFDRGCLACRKWKWLEPYWYPSKRYRARKKHGGAPIAYWVGFHYEDPKQKKK